MTTSNLLFDPKLLAQIMVDKKIRQKIASQSHLWFFAIYMYHHIKYALADFQREFFRITEDQGVLNAIVSAFRGSAKSTILNMSYTLWSILGVQQKKFILILSGTQEQAQQHLKNIRLELETNTLLRDDLGPFTEDSEWGMHSLVLEKYGARITAASIEQSIRGLKHGRYRPQIIIADDLEVKEQMRTKEGRNKLERLFMKEVVPLGDTDTRIITIGNLTHEDSLLSRLMKAVSSGDYTAKVIFCPLLDKNGNSAWPDKFRDQAAVEDYKKRSGFSQESWQEEMMLQPVSAKDRVIHPDWISYYKGQPPYDDKSYRFSAIGVDLAISLKDSANKTAIVIAHVYGYGEDMRIYIDRQLVNKKLEFHEILDAIRDTAHLVSKSTKLFPKIYVEATAFQQAMAQELNRLSCPAEGITVRGDKRERLACVSRLIQNKQILFPDSGAEDLITQLIDFGIEPLDDLADAFSLVINQILILPNQKEIIGTAFMDENCEWQETIIEI